MRSHKPGLKNQKMTGSYVMAGSGKCGSSTGTWMAWIDGLDLNSIWTFPELLVPVRIPMPKASSARRATLDDCSGKIRPSL